MPIKVHYFAGSALVFARAGDSGRHAHRAAQLVVGLDGEFDLNDQASSWAVLAPQQAHRLRGAGTLLAHLFIDPGPVHWQRWQAHGGQPKAPADALIAALRQGATASLERDAAEAIARRWRSEMLPGLIDGGPVHPRIAEATALIDADPTAPGLGHRDLAARVHLSPSRFLGLFRQHTGLPVRNYVLWRRLLTAVQRLEAGDTVTDAAHTAGFADAAHLSRSFRHVLGAAPSELRLPGKSVI